MFIRLLKKEDKYKEFQKSLEQIRKESKKIRQIINEDVYKNAILVAQHHQKIFPQFKNIHQEKTGILVATGPTLNYYSPIKDGIHFGVNSACLLENISLDYLFALDYSRIKENAQILKQTGYIKFFGQGAVSYPHTYYDRKRHIPDAFIDSIPHSYKYYMDIRNYNTINPCIEMQALPDFASCVYGAAYFALYTGIKKLYIVGCDCAKNGYFNTTAQEDHFSSIRLINGWKIFKGYAEAFYPDVEIISVNPIGLIGVFKDVYTEKYLAEYPEIMENIGTSIEIIK